MSHFLINFVRFFLLSLRENSVLNKYIESQIFHTLFINDYVQINYFSQISAVPFDRLNNMRDPQSFTMVNIKAEVMDQSIYWNSSSRTCGSNICTSPGKVNVLQCAFVPRRLLMWTRGAKCFDLPRTEPCSNI